MAYVCSYIIFDFETGGLKPTVNPITEVAAIAITGDKFTEIAQIEKLVAPYDKIPGVPNSKEAIYDPNALSVTGITLALLEDEGYPLKDVAAEFEALMKSAYIHSKVKNAKSVLVGHNVNFDIGFLFQLLSSIGDPNKIMEKYLDGGYDFHGNFQPRYIDTMTVAKERWGGEADAMKDWKLQTVLAKGGIELVDGHRALNDVIGTRDFLVDSILKGRNEGDVNLVQSRRFREHFRF